MKKILGLLFLISTLITSTAIGQEFESSEFKSFKKNRNEGPNIDYGTGFSLGFSNQRFGVGISPNVLFRLHERFRIGPGFTYQYIAGQDLQTGIRFSVNEIGARALMRGFVSPNWFGQAEGVYSHLRYRNRDIDEVVATLNIQNVNLGAGYQFSVGDNFFATASFMVNLFTNEIQPRNAVAVRFSFGFMGGSENRFD